MSSTVVGSAQIQLTAITTAAKTSITQFAADMKKRLTDAGQLKVAVKLDGPSVDKEVNRVKAKFNDLRTTLKDAVKVDVSALQTVLASLEKQATELKAVEQALKNATRSSGGNGSGTGGGSPGGRGGSNDYGAQLRALQGDLRSGALSTSQFEAATRALKTSMDAEIGSLRSLGVLTREQQTQLNALRTTSGQAGQALKGMSDQATRSADQAARAASKAAEEAARASAKATADAARAASKAAADAARATQQTARDAARAQSEGVNRLARDLQVAQSQYQRGALGLREYLREMQRIQTAGQGLSSTLQAGSRDAQNLERVMSGLSQNTAKINDQSIVKIRSDLAAARSEFERATVAAGRFGDTRAATRAYEQAMSGLEQRIKSVGERTTATAGQIRSLNQLSSQLGSQRNALQGTFTQLGLAGNIKNALSSLPQFAAQMGGSLGAAFSQTQQLTGGFSALSGAAGPLGLALGGVVAVVGTLAVGLGKTVGVAADFQQTMTDLRALTQPTAAEFQQLNDTAKNMGLSLGVGPKEAAGALLELNKAGLPTADILNGGAKAALDLAGAAGITADKAAVLATAAQTAFGIAGKDMPQIADVFANFANKTFLGAEDLQQAMAAVGPVAKSAGLNIQQFSGYMATLAQGGFKNMSDAGTSLKTMLLSLQAPSSTASKTLKQIGLDVYDSTGKMRPFSNILDDLRVRMKGMSEEQRNNALKDIFGTDGIRAATIFMGDYNKSLDANSRAIEDNIKAMGLSGEAARVARERNASYAGQVKILKANFEQLTITVGEKVLPYLTSLTTGLIHFIEEVKNGGPVIREIKGDLVLLAGVLLVIKANAIQAAGAQALGALTTTFTTLTTLIPTLTGGLTGMAGAQALLNTTIAASPAIIAMAVAAIGLYANRIISNIASVNDAINQSELDTGNTLMAKVNAYIKAGDALSLAKAKFLLANDQMLQAQRGNVVGHDFAGNAIYKVDPKALELAHTRLAAAQAELKAAQAQSSGGLKGQGPLLPGQVREGAPSDYGQKILQQSLAKTGVKTADSLVDFCAQWVRLTLGKAQPKIASYVNTLFQRDYDHDGHVTAVDAANNAKAAGLYRKFTKGSDKDLKPGDTVFYTDGGQNHVGIYIGNGMVRGNNRVSMNRTGNPVGDVAMTSLGRVSGYMRADDLNAAANGGRLPAVGKIAQSANDQLKAAQAEGERLIRQYGLALESGNRIWISKAKTAVDAFRSHNKEAWAGIKDELSAVEKKAKGTSVVPVTASSILALDSYKKALKGMSEEELKSRLASAQANNEKDRTRALLAELNRREREHADSLKISSVELVKFRAALKGKTDDQLKELLLTDRVKQTAAAYSAVLAEQTRRHNADEAAQKKAGASAQVAADRRANLVREMRQAISVFALSEKQNKVTDASQLAFSNHMEDFRARVLKLPPALQQGTQALFDQARGLIASSTAHMKVTGALKLGGAALDDYKKKVASMSDGDLQKVLAGEKVTGNLQKQSLILAEVNRRAEEKVRADQKNTASAEGLSRRVQKLNEDFALQVKQGRVTESSLQNYRQGLEDAKSTLDKLPPAYQSGTQALITNGKALQDQGQQVINRRTELDKLKESVVGWSLAELQAARARVVASGGDTDKLKLIDAQIGKIKTLSDAQADQAHAESLLSQASTDASGIQAQYEARKTAAKGNLAELYQIELEFGHKFSDAQNAEADAQAKKDAASVSEKYAALLKLDGISDTRRRQLEADRDRELGAIEQHRLNVRAANVAAAATAETEAKRNLDDAVLTIDRQTRDQINKNNLESLQRRTAAVEAQQEQELSVEGLTERQKFDIRQSFEKRLTDAKTAEVEASRKIELQAEEDRFNDAVADASSRLGVSQAFLNAKTQLEKEHTSNVLAINTRLNDQLRDYKINLDKEMAKGNLAGAKDAIDAQLGNLGGLTAAERKAAREVLTTWRATYAALGKAGEDAVKAIDTALGKLDSADKKAREKAGKAIVDPSRLGTDTAAKLARLGKPDDATSASEQAVARYSDLLNGLKDDLAVAETGLKEFEGIADSALTPDDKKVKDGLQKTVDAYNAQIPVVEKAASDAGTAAANAYTLAQQDQAQESALGLAEIDYQLAQQEHRDGGPAYKAGLAAALAYWRGRFEGLDKLAPDYAKAATEIEQKVSDIQGKITNLKGSNQLAESFKQAASIMGKNSPLQASISAGLDGLAAYFTAGGKAGGKGAILQGAAALVGGLIDVFKTGDEDIDKVVGTFVSGLQSTLMQLAQGNWIGAIVSGVTTVVSTVIDIFQGGANSARKSAEEIKNATKDIKFFNMSGYAKTVSRGGFWGWLGFKKSQIDQESLDIAKSLGDAIYNAITSGMLDGIKQGKSSFASLGIDLKKALGEQILQGLIDGFMKGAVMQGVLQPFLDTYIKAMKSGDAQALAAAAEGIQQAAITANGQLQNFYENVLVPVSKQMGNFGSDTTSTSGSGSTSSGDLFGNAPGAQLGVAHVEVSLPPETFKPLTRFSDTLPTWERITTNLDTLLAGASITPTQTQGSAGTDARAMMTFASAVPAWAAAVPVFAEGAADLRQGVAEWRALVARGDTQLTKFTPNRSLT